MQEAIFLKRGVWIELNCTFDKHEANLPKDSKYSVALALSVVGNVLNSILNALVKAQRQYIVKLYLLGVCTIFVLLQEEANTNVQLRVKFGQVFTFVQRE